MDTTTRPALRLSIVLPTLNRPQVIPKTLGYLARQDIDPGEFEVIIIEDGCSDAIRHAVEDARTKVPFAVSFMQNDGHRGPGYTENRGIRAARAPLVLIMADDIFLDPGALRAHIETHDAHPEQEIAVLGKVIQSPELSDTVFIRHWDPFGFLDLGHPEELPYYMFWACNISVKRDFLMNNGMFLEHRGRAADGSGSGGAAHEDVELGYRLHRYGLRILYNESAWGYHYHPYTLAQAEQRYYERGVNWDEFRKFVPDPEFVVVTHLLNRKTFREYVRVFSRPNTLKGMDRYLAWHILRHLIRITVFNSLTTPFFWKPLTRIAEKSPLAAKLMTRRLYGSYLYYYFAKGVVDVYKAENGSHRTPAKSGGTAM